MRRLLGGSSSVARNRTEKRRRRTVRWRFFHPGGASDDRWWAESDRFLTHLARVMSFASDTYFRPALEQRFFDGRCTVRISSQGRASPPYMAPFHFLHMQPIFNCACETISRGTMKSKRLMPRSGGSRRQFLTMRVA